MAISEGVTVLSVLSEISRGSSGFITRGEWISVEMKFKTNHWRPRLFDGNKRSLYQLRPLSEEENEANQLFF